MSGLREVRQELGLTQVEFAARLDIPVETYRMWDSGRRTVPSAVLARAAEVAGSHSPNPKRRELKDMTLPPHVQHPLRGSGAEPARKPAVRGSA